MTTSTPCPACGGAGSTYVRVVEPGAGHAAVAIDHIAASCEDCDGTGEVQGQTPVVPWLREVIAHLAGDGERTATLRAALARLADEEEHRR